MRFEVAPRGATQIIHLVEELPPVREPACKLSQQNPI